MPVTNLAIATSRNSRKWSSKLARDLALGLAGLAASLASLAQARDIRGTVLVGYQGWFRCPGDGSPGNGWNHWFSSLQKQDQQNNPVIRKWDTDIMPDVSEFPAKDVCIVPGKTANGQPIRLFSSFRLSTAMIHAQWMQKYGIDGLLLQRFVTRLPSYYGEKDTVLRNMVAAAAHYGRAIAIEYDLTDMSPAGFGQIRDDWQHIEPLLKQGGSQTSLTLDNAPVVSLWGLGFGDARHPGDTAQALQLIRWFHARGMAVIGGVPYGWSVSTGDASNNPAWQAVYKAFDIIQPWAPGRFDSHGAHAPWVKTATYQTNTLTRSSGTLLQPVVFPGFSWHARHPEYPKDQIARQNGSFFDSVAAMVGGPQVCMAKIAMFDEVNEGTAIFKLVGAPSLLPTDGNWIAPYQLGTMGMPDAYLRKAQSLKATIARAKCPPFKGFSQ